MRMLGLLESARSRSIPWLQHTGQSNMLFFLLHTPAQVGIVFFNHAPCSGKCSCDVPATLTLHPAHRAAQTLTSKATQTSKRRMHGAIRPALKTPSFIFHSNAHAAPSRYLPSSSPPPSRSARPHRPRTRRRSRAVLKPPAPHRHF